MKFCFAVCVLLGLFVLSPLYGQTSTATIVGTVSDQTGAVVPGAQVSATHVDTGRVRTTSSNERGDYYIANVAIGRYNVAAELEGFSKQEVSDIVLQLDQTARVNLVLTPGQVTEVITVEGTAPLLASDSSDVGSVIENKQIVELPLNRREFLQLALLQPGVVPPPPGSFLERIQGPFTSFSAMGTREEYQQVSLHGITDMDPQNNNLAVRPNVEAIQEFKIQTSNYSAELPSKGGTVVNLAIKSGTNRLHGSIYEFFRNSSLDGRNFFSISPDTPPFRQNQYGGTVGGPIVKNKTFGFFAFGGLRSREARTAVNIVPNAEQRNGIFDPNRFGIIHDPLTFNPNTRERQPFPNNTIPRDRIHSVSADIMTFVDPVNNPGDPARNLITRASAKDDVDQYNSRLDHIFGDNDTLMFSYNITDRKSEFPSIGGVSGVGVGTGGFKDVGGAQFNDRSQHMSFAYTHIFSPNLLNEFRGGFVRFQHNEIGRNQGTLFEAERWGIPGSENRTDFAAWPTLRVTGYNFPSEGRTSIYWNTVYQLANSVTWNKGNHNLKMGWSGQLINGFLQFCFCPGTYGSSGQYVGLSQEAGPGDAFAQFLLGDLNRVSKWEVFEPNYLYGQQHAFYFQDDWKVSPKLTLNIGVRYDYAQPLKDKQDRVASWDPANGEVVYPENAPLVIRDPNTGSSSPFNPPFPFRTTSNRGLYQSDKMNFAPRFGYAYKISSKTVSRGAFGAFNGMNPTRHESLSTFSSPFLFFPSQGPNIDPEIPTINWDVGFTGAARTISTSLWKARPLTGLQHPYILMWNQGFQHTLKDDLLLDVAYVGTAGRQQTVFYNENVCPPGEGNCQTRRPYRDIGVVRSFFTGGNSSYHSLQVRLEKRFSKGVGFAVNYTLSKSIDHASTDVGVSGDGAGAENNFDVHGSQRGLSAFDIPQRFVFNYVWELPWGPGHGRFDSGPASYILGGWQLTGIIALQSGYPFTVSDRSRTNGAGGGRPDRICDGRLSNPTLNRAFDTDCFTQPGLFQFGTSGRNIIRADGNVSIDVGLYKNFMLGEEARLQFRAEAFNLPNHANFSIPNRNMASGGRGVVSRAFNPRRVQFSLKLSF
jgi:type 1 fimbria pilin